MNHHEPQLDRHVPPESSNVGSSSSRQLGMGEMCLIVLVVLVLHWIGMQCIVNWLGGEGQVAHAQAVSTSNSMPDDGWRRTARGWEYNMNESNEAPGFQASPTRHISAFQFWPAAAAACMLLLITGLPDTRINKGE